MIVKDYAGFWIYALHCSVHDMCTICHNAMPHILLMWKSPSCLSTPVSAKWWWLLTIACTSGVYYTETCQWVNKGVVSEAALFCESNTVKLSKLHYQNFRNKLGRNKQLLTPEQGKQTKKQTRHTYLKCVNWHWGTRFSSCKTDNLVLQMALRSQ